MAIRVCKGKYNISKDDKIDYTFLEVDDNNKFIIVIDKDEKPNSAAAEAGVAMDYGQGQGVNADTINALKNRYAGNGGGIGKY